MADHTVRHRWLILPVIGGLLILAWLRIVQQSGKDSGPASTVSPAARTGAFPEIKSWEPIFRGIELCRGTMHHPRLMKMTAVRVDLSEPTVSFLVTPSNGDEPLDCAARTPSEFLEEFGCQVAINGSAFTPRATGYGLPLDVRGLSLSRGDLYSPTIPQFDALLISRDHRAWIDEAPVDPRDAYHGLSGFHILLRSGDMLGDDRDVQPRSAVGVSKDGRYLILMIIDGRQMGYSEGATTRETADWLVRLGAHDGLNLDGGGSSALVMEGPEGKPLVLNRPSGIYERRVANHLGVMAEGL